MQQPDDFMVRGYLATSRLNTSVQQAMEWCHIFLDTHQPGGVEGGVGPLSLGCEEEERRRMKVVCGKHLRGTLTVPHSGKSPPRGGAEEGSCQFLFRLRLATSFREQPFR